MLYVNDTLEGAYKRWFRKKNFLEKGNYIHGLRDGKWVEFNDKKDTTQICFWKQGIPQKTYIYIFGIDSLTNKEILVKREAKLIQWQFENDYKAGYWVFESILGSNTIYDFDGYWEVYYSSYIYESSGYHYIGSKFY